ncbi:response regulator receiver modulated diguanylate cyclase [Nitrosomonas cryotolerans]|uniref:diguanylate cyclase n=1 Tax=Nitrosomonas cryotolerans ATCC 49181 TaxID=1131553 RepID=A0A1N6HDX9_9PROT|nr:diguanylate cyclase [Nitrosomonas cryotolerans]SFP73398.1 response regulator receiver modulated diguanylate cyclase [Nitrosomonas cryotolerans]SIO17899.1 response regulator receiver modulated diguanylate cyclase [Nitrosomonas cryotolerans ATCC 49181]
MTVPYAEKLPGKISEIETAWKDFQIEQNAEILHELYRLVHGLANSSKAFGFLELSTVARALVQDLKHLIHVGIVTSGPEFEQINGQMLELRRAMNIAPSYLPEIILTPTDMGRIKQEPINSKQIFLIDDDVETAEDLALQLRYYGYEVKVFNQLGEFQSAIKQIPSAIVLMNIEFPEDRLSGIKAIKEIQKNLAQPARVIFISAYDNIILRLGAVRAGSIAYFVKPVNSAELIDQLDSLTSFQAQEPFRVLIVDDSSALLAYHEAILKQAGMAVRTVLKPMDIMETLHDFNPDLILMDVYMPECSGIELAKVIRQLNNFVSIAIVYLSSENDFNTQLEAMSLGGDDFLVKPIEPQQLVSAVTSRILRARLLRSFMVRDSLTRLFNHTSIKEQFSREVARSRRLGTPLSFAMVDIDYFKKVNDTYGHAAGDRVIKSLARLLKQRLRRTDIVGRYGGEEFAIIMTDTDAFSAAKVMDEIRKAFSYLVHVSDDKEFSVSFSCGVADLAHFADVASLGDAADKALYQAKEKGRNQVMLHSDSSGNMQPLI